MALIYIGSQAAVAQMKPLGEIIAGRNSEQSYPAVRCGGLWAAIAKWGGSEQLGVANYQKTIAVAANLIGIAARLRAEPNGTTEEFETESATRDVASVAQIYLDRFQRNYVENGSAWSSDSGFQDDMEICSLLSSGEAQ